MSGNGKKEALNALRKGNLLPLLGNIDASFQSVVDELCQLIPACYETGLKVTPPKIDLYHAN